ncbi:MAG: ABC transporter ATP-binding protein [Deltaproteobacteria bacterium]|nr:ABC transporter ATP-binding protein [Deltaproteobacteria bacterium]MCL5278062.1 ABC transporter ATP-binding protein [Deltaproteobacteria bacterium]
MLTIENLHTSYSGIEVLHGITMDVGRGEKVALLGANGAGKTTTLSSIVGIAKEKAGRVVFDRQDITDIETYNAVRKGIVLVPEGRHIFTKLTVEENILIGGFLMSRHRDRLVGQLERVYAIFPLLRDRRRQMAGTLSGGEQQMLAIGRGLMSNPKLMLLDEPSLGLSPIMVSRIFKIIDEINYLGVSILIVEQNANIALEFTDKTYVLELGHINLSGPSRVLKDDERIKTAYLGM